MINLLRDCEDCFVIKTLLSERQLWWIILAVFHSVQGLRFIAEDLCHNKNRTKKLPLMFLTRAKSGINDKKSAVMCILIWMTLLLSFYHCHIFLMKKLEEQEKTSPKMQFPLIPFYFTQKNCFIISRMMKIIIHSIFRELEIWRKDDENWAMKAKC